MTLRTFFIGCGLVALSGLVTVVAGLLLDWAAKRVDRRSAGRKG